LFVFLDERLLFLGIGLEEEAPPLPRWEGIDITLWKEGR
jgi:hypothetical protein